jgi:hypothetical protein
MSFWPIRKPTLFSYINKHRLEKIKYILCFWIIHRILLFIYLLVRMSRLIVTGNIKHMIFGIDLVLSEYII